MSGLISNPPYNIKWEPYEDKRFIPESAPKSNANYAFIQTALAEIDHQAVFLLPMGVLSSSNKKEKEIRKWLLEEGYIQGVIALPKRMFESTSIPVCLLVIRKNRETKDVMMVDARTLGNEEVRYQKGQFGGSAHTNREYIKKVTVLSDERIEQLVDDVVHYKEGQGISCRVTLDQIQEQGWLLTPSRYMETEEKLSHRRDYREIVTDINKIARLRNALKLVINETLAKKLHLEMTAEALKKDKEETKQLNQTIKALIVEELILKDYLQLTKNKNQMEFKQNDGEIQSEMMVILFNMWKSHIMFLNNMENEYLSELRDALLPELMSGKLDLEKLGI
ncbi:N-6 DNA methylase [Aerococcus christensenii]|uniref:N-6 DNA methylase n=1 Tax=Aerococcus christensenii TaxID=87541 RepID=UPI0023A96D41|nr:N-6 DNA methylase [Aerococcus christensenii]WEB71515.1 N-6 DNA methylase [Aerococcus christensenii]